MGAGEDPESFSRPLQGPLKGCWFLLWTSPSSSQVQVFGHCHPHPGRGKGRTLRGRGRGKGKGPGSGRGTRRTATRGEGRRRPRARAGPGAGRVGRGRARTYCHADGLTAAWAPHHHGRVASSGAGRAGFLHRRPRRRCRRHGDTKGRERAARWRLQAPPLTAAGGSGARPTVAGAAGTRRRFSLAPLLASGRCPAHLAAFYWLQLGSHPWLGLFGPAPRSLTAPRP